MLAMRDLRVRHHRQLRLRGPGVENFNHKFGSVADVRLHADSGSVRLHNLIDNGQPESRAAFKAGLKWLKNFFDHVGRNPGTIVTNTDTPVIALRFNRDANGSALVEGTHRIFQQVPEHLLHAISIHGSKGLRNSVIAFNLQGRRLRAVGKKHQRGFKQRNEVHARKLVALLAGVGEEIRNDGIQARRLAGDDIDKRALLIVERRNLREDFDGAGDGGQRIADFMSNTGGQPSYGGEAVTHADLALKATQLCPVFKGINVADGAVRRHGQRGNGNAESLFSSRGSETAHLALSGDTFKMRKTVKKQFRDIPAVNRRGSAFQQLLSGSIHQSDATFYIGSDQAAANGVDHVFMQGLKAEQFAAFILQLHACLSKLGCKSDGKVRHGKISKQVDENYGQERLGIWAWR